MDSKSTSANPPHSAEYVVVARRYRPQTFADLIGQEQVSLALSKAIESHRVGHAYLFTGARGVGKTSAARILAKALNCEQGPTPTPCNQCDICQSVTAGEDVDVLEIDGASARGIDEIRQLRSNVNVRPSRARFKVYIIDEVHMFTREAFNALLKTLEEPPEHVKFIFCTTDPEKIPITVLSRCQRFDFPPVKTASIAERLRTICESEGVEAEPEALQLVARRAAGSMRDSQSLLEQLLSFCEGRIQSADVHRMLGTARGSSLSQLANELAERRADGSLRALEAAIREGVDVGQLAEQLLAYFRDVLAAAVGCSPDLMLQALPDDFPLLQQLGTRLGIETLLAIIQVLDQAISRMRQSPHVRTLFEVALVRITQLEDLDEISRLVSQLQAGIAPAGGQGAAATSGPAAARAEKKTAERTDLNQAMEILQVPREVLRERIEQELSQRPEATTPLPATAVVTSVAEPAPAPVPSLADSNREPRVVESQQVQPIATAVGRQTMANAALDEAAGVEMDFELPPQSEQAGGAIDSVAERPAAAQDLTAANAASVWRKALERLAAAEDITADFASKYSAVRAAGPARLVVEFEAEYNKNYCERPERFQRLQQAVSAELARPVQIEFSVSARAIAAAAEPRQPAAASRRQRWRELENHPLVAQAKQMFDAEVVDVQEPKKHGSNQ